MKLYPFDPAYPRSLRDLVQPPLITVSGPLDPSRRVVAVVGARSASHGALGFAHALAYYLAKAGIIVVSGGALGVDRIAHVGAMKAGGTTWCVACSGRGEIYPKENRELFERIEQSDSSRMIWPFPDGTPKDELTPRYRNKVLVGLAEAVVVVQARAASGSRNAMTWTRSLERKLYLVPGAPWDPAFEGTMLEGARGEAEPVWSIDHLFDKLGLPAPDPSDPVARECGYVPRALPSRLPRRTRHTYSAPPAFPVDRKSWSETEKQVFSALSIAPIQQDTIIEKVGLPTSSTLTALLTLSLKDVVVEGPDGFFRRRIAT